jgi:protein arginine phosphatase
MFTKGDKLYLLENLVETNFVKGDICEVIEQKESPNQNMYLVSFKDRSGKTVGLYTVAEKQLGGQDKSTANMLCNLPLKQSNQMDKKNILFVCKGNTCRSPIAQFIVKQGWNTKLNAESAGIIATNGTPLSKNAIKIMRNKFLYPSAELDCFRSRHISKLKTLESYDFVVAMDIEVYNYLKKEYPDKGVENWSIEDPYGKDMSFYEKTAQEIRAKIEEFAQINGIQQ